MRSSICPKRRYRSNSLRVSVMGLKLGRMTHSTMKQIAIQNGYAMVIFVRFTELWNFPWYAWTRSERWWLISGNVRKSHHGLEIGDMMQCTMRRITSCNGYAQPMFAFFNFGRPRVLSFSERLVCFGNKQNYHLHTMLSIMVESLDNVTSSGNQLWKR